MWLLCGSYYSSTQSEEHCLSIFFFLSNMSQMCDNTDEVKLNLFEFLANYDAKDLEKDKACFKIPLNPRCIDFFYFK